MADQPISISPTDQQAVTVAQGYAEAEAMLRDLIGPCIISDTAIRVARDHMMQFRRLSVSSASAETLALQAIKAVTATAKDGAAGLSRIMAIANAAGVHAPYSDLLQDPAVALIVERPRTEWAHLFKPDATGCAIPPEGWQCSRARGHAGPCAASPNASIPPVTDVSEPAPNPVPATNQAGEVGRLRNPSEFKAAIELWFSRDLTETQRRLFCNTLGFPGVEANGLGLQVRILRHVVTALATKPATSQEGDHAAILIRAAEQEELAASLHRTAVADGLTDDLSVTEWCEKKAKAFRAVAAIVAATPTPPTLSDDLRETALVGIERIMREGIHENDGPNRIWIDGVAHEGPVADFTIRTFRKVGEIARAALARAQVQGS